jgi:outer membrane protein TolC
MITLQSYGVSMRAIILITLIFVSVRGAASDDGPVISLEDYLSTVRDKHDSYRSAKKSYEASKLTAYESHTIISPYLFGSLQYTDDEKPNLLFNYQKVETAQTQLGVSEQTSFGLMGRAYYSLTNTAYTGLELLTPPSFNIQGIQGSATLELTLSLWRNWLGNETKLQMEQGDASASAEQYNQSYQMKMLLVSAETAFWNLYLARESVKVSEDAVERANQLYNWHAHRAELGLSNRADLLQAEAALQQRKLELRSAQDQEVSAGRNFNSARGIDSSQVSEQILPLTPEQIADLQVPVRKEFRDDVKAAEQQIKATKSAADLSRERYLPTLELFGNASTNSPNPMDYTDVLGNSFNTQRPTTSIGIRLNASLDLGLVHDVREGWEARKQAAEYSYKRKLLEQETQWNDLVDRFGQDKVRVSLYDKLEKAQKVKLDYERERRGRGLTTTQQVIYFEQDYQQAQLGRIQTEADLLQVLAQMKLYGDIYGLR